MIEGLIAVVIKLVVLGFIAALLLYAISAIPIMEPIRTIARAAVIVIACLIAILILLPLMGVRIA